MLVEKELIIEAKNKFGDKAIDLIRDYFKLENFDEKNSKGSCPFGHNDDSPSFIWNPKQNSFHCFSCNRNFGILDLYMRQGLTYLEAVEKLFDDVNIKYKFGERGVKSKRSYNYPQIECAEDRSKVDAYFLTRKISKETLDYCNVAQDIQGNIVWKFFDENDTLLTVKLRPSRKIGKNDKTPKEWYLDNYDYTPILYNMNRADYSNGALVITEGQIDCLSVIEAGYYNVVSVPGGTANMKWIEETFEWLEKFDQIIIWSDQDEAGLKLRREVIARLGQWRCKFVEIPEELQRIKEIKDANAILYEYGKQTVLDLIANAQETPITGVANMADIPDFDIEKAEGIYTGLENLDNILYKLIFGSLLVVTGQRGAGKSSFVNQALICESINQGYPVFVFSGELSSPVLKSWIDLTMIGPENVTMKGKFIHKINVVAKEKQRKWYDGKIWIFDDKKTNSADVILDKAISVIRKYGCKVIILDNLSVIDIGANDNNLYEKQKDFITRLIGMADLYNVLICLVVHPRKLPSGITIVSNDDVAGSAAITNLAQYVIPVKRFSDREKAGEKDRNGNWKPGKKGIEEDVGVEVTKNRYTGMMGEARVYFDYRSRRFYLDEKNLNKRYGWDIDNTKPLYGYDPRKEKLPEAIRGD